MIYYFIKYPTFNLNKYNCNWYIGPFFVAYHTKCIDPWLTKNRRVCPVCKRKVFAADERVVTDSESDTDADDSTPLIRDGHQGEFLNFSAVG